MKKTIIIISVVVAAYFVLWYIAGKQSQGPIDPLSNSALTAENGEANADAPSASPLAAENGEANADAPSAPIAVDTKLNLSHKGLSQVPEYVFSRTALLELDLSDNRLTGAIPAEIRHLRGLKLLDLSDNLLTGVPAEIGQLENLEYLDLSNNQLTGLPLELGNLQNLIVIDLSGNDYSQYDLDQIKEKWGEGVRLIEN